MFFSRKKMIIHVTGMHCGKCLNRIKEGLESIDNVKKVQGDVDKGEVIVFYKEGINQEEIRDAVEKLGYGVTGIKDVD